MKGVVYSSFRINFTRKQERKPRLNGPNRYGRSGCRRCLNCRKWRQKVCCNLEKTNCQCVFVDPNRPCKLCEDRGLTCGPEDKVLGPKTRSLPAFGRLLVERQGQAVLSFDRPVHPPEGLSFTEIEMLYIQELLNQACFSACTIHGYGWIHSILGHVDLFTNRVARFLFASPSKSVRYATLACAAAFLDRSRPEIAWHYLRLCYKQLYHAISKSAFVEIAYTTYFMLLIPTSGPNMIDEISVHLSGLTRALQSLDQTLTELSSYEWLWMEQTILGYLDFLRFSMVQNFFSCRPQYVSTSKIRAIFSRARQIYSHSVVPDTVMKNQGSFLRGLSQFRKRSVCLRFLLLEYS